MKYLNFLVAPAFLMIVSLAHAAAPEGSTAECKDGSYYSGSSKRGACSRHGGIKEWYGAAAAAPAAATAPQTSSGPTGPQATQPQQQQSSSMPGKSSRMAASGGGAGQVWLNTDSKVYHCPGTRYYGTTKHGEYMSESQAISAGARADHNKACAK